MDNLSLKPGDGLLLKAFTQNLCDGLQVSYRKPRKGYHLGVFLGVFDPDSDGDAGAGTDERLNALGWVFDPTRAEKAQAKAKAKREAGK